MDVGKFKTAVLAVDFDEEVVFLCLKALPCTCGLACF